MLQAIKFPLLGANLMHYNPRTQSNSFFWINQIIIGGRMRILSRFTVIAAVVALIAVSAFAQGTTATLTGTVTTGGKALPGATITVSSPALIGTRTAVSGSNGDYNIPALPPGDYTVKVELEGMQTLTRKTRLSLAETSRVDADLKVTSMSEAITVTASAPAVMESPQIAANFTKATMEKLPVPRTITSAVDLTPGAGANS